MANNYKSSRDIFARSQNNLNKLTSNTKNITETAASINADNTGSSLQMKVTQETTVLNSSLQNMNNVLSELNNSVVGLQSALKNIAENHTTINSLLATQLVSLTQINSLVTAFRSDYILSKNGNKNKGISYYDRNLILRDISNIKTSDKTVDSILSSLRNAANYANRSTNAIRSKLGSRQDLDDNSIFNKILGLADQGKQFAGLGTLLPMYRNGGKYSKFIENAMSADTSTIGSLIESFLGANGKRKFKDIKGLGSKFLDSNNPLKQMLGGLMEKAGMTNLKKEREKDPDLVYTALAPFADDIKDIVELKVKGIHSRPTKEVIPEYATPVWIVNSPDQKNYITSNKTLSRSLREQRIHDITRGIANNYKDIYGNDLLEKDIDEKWIGSATEGFSENEIKKMINRANRLERRSQYHGATKIEEFLGKNKILNKLLDDNNTGVQMIGGMAGNALTQILGSHAGGKRNKGSSGAYLAGLHNGEKVLGPNALDEHEKINDISKIIGLTISTLTSAIKLEKYKAGLLVAYTNKDPKMAAKVKVDTTILAQDEMTELGAEKENKIGTNIIKIIGSKLFKANTKETTKEYFGLKGNSEADVAQQAEAQAQQGQETIDQLVKEKQRMDEELFIRKMIIDRTNKARIWAAQKANNVKLRAKKMANKVRLFAREKAGNLKNIAINAKNHVALLGTKVSGTVKRLGKKLAAKTASILDRVKNSVLIQKAKMVKTALFEKIKSLISTTGDILGTAGSVIGKILDTIRIAIPVVGQAITAVAGPASILLLGGIGLAALLKAKKGQNSNIKLESVIKKVSGKISDVKNKILKKEEKEEKEASKAEVAKQENEKKAEEKDTNRTIAENKSFTSQVKYTESNVSTENKNTRQIKIDEEEQLEGPVKYLNKMQRKMLLNNTTKMADLFSKKPKQAASMAWLLNGGYTVLGLQSASTDELESLNELTSTSNSTSVTPKKESLWTRLTKKLTKKKLLADDVGSEGYSEDAAVALAQNKNNSMAAKLINAFAKVYGHFAFTDSNGDPLYTTNLRKQAQEENLRGGLTGTSSNGSAITAAQRLFDGSSYIGYDEDGTWGNSSTKDDIFKSKYFASNGNGSAECNLVTNIINNNWKKYKTDNNISDEDAGTTISNGSLTYLNGFFNKEYKKMYDSFVKRVAFADDTAKNFMHESIAKSIKNSTPWIDMKDLSNSSDIKNRIKQNINARSQIDYGNYGLGHRHNRFGGANTKDSDFINASKYALVKGYKEQNGGTYPQFFKDYLNKNGINVNYNSSANNIKRSLLRGNPVILMGQDNADSGLTPYGDTPHYIVATNYDGKNIRVIDSESRNDYDIYNADNVLRHSTIKISTNSGKSGYGRITVNSGSHNIYNGRSSKNHTHKHIQYNRGKSFKTSNNYLKSYKSHYGKGDEVITNSNGSNIKSNSNTVTTPTPTMSSQAIGNMYVTLQGYVNGYDLLSKYKTGHDIWDKVNEALKAEPKETGVTPAASSTTKQETSITPTKEKEINEEVKTQTSSVVQPEVKSDIYQKNGTMYVVNNIEYGVKTNIESIIEEFKELNNVQDDSLEVLNTIYSKLLKRNGKNPNNIKIKDYDYSLKNRRYTF